MQIATVVPTYATRNQRSAQFAPWKVLFLEIVLVWMQELQLLRCDFPQRLLRTSPHKHHPIFHSPLWLQQQPSVYQAFHQLLLHQILPHHQIVLHPVSLHPGSENEASSTRQFGTAELRKFFVCAVFLSFPAARADIFCANAPKAAIASSYPTGRYARGVAIVSKRPPLFPSWAIPTNGHNLVMPGEGKGIHWSLPVSVHTLYHHRNRLRDWWQMLGITWTE